MLGSEFFNGLLVKSVDENQPYDESDDPPCDSLGTLPWVERSGVRAHHGASSMGPHALWIDRRAT